MSPWRTLQCFRPARSSRARASASMSSDMSMPSPRSMLRPEQLEHAAGAGAEIEQRTDRAIRERGLDRALDRRVRDMQAADAVPFGGVLAEIGLRRGGARGAHRREPAAVAQHHRIGRIEPPDQQSARCRQRRRARRADRTPSFPRGSDRPGPASASSFRCREMRGCDWRRILVRSETVRSASASSASMRRRVPSPAARSARMQGVEIERRRDA